MKAEKQIKYSSLTPYLNLICDCLIENRNSHICVLFKEGILWDYSDEYLKRSYLTYESKDRIPKFANFYKNYLKFFCKPTFTDFDSNEIMQQFNEKKAEIYYNQNFKGKMEDKLNMGIDNERNESNNEENDVKIAVEYCRASGGKTMAIGTAKGMIDKGAWQSFPQPHLPKSKSDYKIIYRVGFFYKSFKFIGELLRDNNDLCWFIYPYYKEFNNNMLVFSDIIKPSRYWQKDIYNITIKNDKLQKILYTFRESQIFYSTDLDGTDFKSAIDFPIRR